MVARGVRPDPALQDTSRYAIDQAAAHFLAGDVLPPSTHRPSAIHQKIGASDQRRRW